MTLANSASYIDGDNIAIAQVAKNRRRPLRAWMAGIFAVLALFMAFQPLLAGLLGSKTATDQGTVASAGSPGILCVMTTGIGMDSKNSWEQVLFSVPQGQANGRTWTVQEALGNGAAFVSYEGEGEAKDAMFTRAKEKPNVPNGLIRTAGGGAGSFDTYYQTNAQKLESTRDGVRTCIPGALPVIGNGLLSISNFITGAAQFAAVNAFNPNLVCQDPSKPNDGCLNLLKVLGGTGKGTDGGIIGVLTSSIYYPLLVMAVAITALWVGYQGLAKRRFREALFGVIWVVLSVVFGLALLLNPALLSRAPMAVSNAISTCVIGAFNGQNCMGDSGSKLDYANGDTTSQNVCLSAASGATLDEQMSLTANSITCSIWRAFILEPLAQGSFGTSFNNLDVNSPQMAKVLKDANLDPNQYCVSLGSTASADSQRGKTLDLNDPAKNKVCNLLTYQMYLQVNAKSDGDPNFTTNSFDPRWYRVVMAAASDEGLWSHWSGDVTGGMAKVGIAGMSVVISALGTFILLVVSVFAMVYYITSLILLAFAPLFFLLGVHPGRGKAILFGWIEKVVSSVLKYLASAVFLVVAIAIYGGVLANLSNLGTTLLFVIIVTMALFMYRSELMNLIGRVNMGGEQLSSAVSDKLRQRVSGVGKLGADVAIAGFGGGIGGMVAAGGNPISIKGIKSLGSGAISGVKDGTKRTLKRQGGVIGNVARQYDRNTVDNKQDMRAKMVDSQNALNSATGLADERRTEYNDAQKATETFTERQETNRENLVRAEGQFERVKATEDGLVDDFRHKNSLERSEKLAAIQASDATAEEKVAQSQAVEDTYNEAVDFAELRDWQNMMRDTKLQMEVALVSGDTEGAKSLEYALGQYSKKSQALASGIGAERLQNYQDEYDTLLDKELRNADLRPMDVGGEGYQDLANLRTFAATSEAMRAQHVANEAQALAALNEAEAQAHRAKVENETYGDAYINMRPGDGFTDRDVRRTQKAVDNRLVKENVETKEEQKERKKAEANPSMTPFQHTQGTIPTTPAKPVEAVKDPAPKGEDDKPSPAMQRKNAYDAQGQDTLRDRGPRPDPKPVEKDSGGGDDGGAPGPDNGPQNPGPDSGPKGSGPKDPGPKDSGPQPMPTPKPMPTPPNDTEQRNDADRRQAEEQRRRAEKEATDRRQKEADEAARRSGGNNPPTPDDKGRGEQSWDKMEEDRRKADAERQRLENQRRAEEQQQREAQQKAEEQRRRDAQRQAADVPPAPTPDPKPQEAPQQDAGPTGGQNGGGTSEGPTRPRPRRRGTGIPVQPNGGAGAPAREAERQRIFTEHQTLLDEVSELQGRLEGLTPTQRSAAERAINDKVRQANALKRQAESL